MYLDTSAIVRYALAINGSPHQRDQTGQQTLRDLLDSDATIVASPITLAEFSSVMYTHLRDTTDWLGAFDEEAVDRAEKELMTWISTGRVRVRNLGARAFEMGMSYVGAASREHARKMKAWDAIHLYEACRWSREIGEQVIIATADSDFQGFLDVFPEFCQHVRLLDTTNPPAPQAAAPAST